MVALDGVQDKCTLFLSNLNTLYYEKNCFVIFINVLFDFLQSFRLHIVQYIFGISRESS